MSLSFQCVCKRTLTVDEKYIGKKVRCGACKTVLEVPTPVPAQQAASGSGSFDHLLPSNALEPVTDEHRKTESDVAIPKRAPEKDRSSPRRKMHKRAGARSGPFRDPGSDIVRKEHAKKTLEETVFKDLDLLDLDKEDEKKEPRRPAGKRRQKQKQKPKQARSLLVWYICFGLIVLIGGGVAVYSISSSDPVQEKLKKRKTQKEKTIKKKADDSQEF